MRIIGLRGSKSDQKALARIRKERTEILHRLKDVPCRDCGLKYPPEVMDFDHLPGRGKRKNVSKFGRAAQIISEAKRCEVVCSNCHRLRTASRRKEASNMKNKRLSWLESIADAVQSEREDAK